MKLEAQMRCEVKNRGRRVLFARVLFLREGEALGFFTAPCAFVNVVSAFVVSHKF